MIKPINKERAKIWNERFAALMEKKKLTQRQFAKEYSDKFGYAAQADVCRWLHVGEKTTKKKMEERGFPSFETMSNIATMLEVSVAYLIGETDYESFEEERTARYIGLSADGVRAIHDITKTGKAIPPFYRYPDSKITNSLEKLLVSKSFVSFLEGIKEISEAIEKKKNPFRYFEKAVNRIPESCRDAAIALFRDPEDAVNELGVIMTDELCGYAKELEEAEKKEKDAERIADSDVNAAGYKFFKTHFDLLRELTGDEETVIEYRYLSDNFVHKRKKAKLDKSKK